VILSQGSPAEWAERDKQSVDMDELWLIRGK
jgi:hypothetical protein